MTLATDDGTEVAVRDGSRVVLRPMHRTDAGRLVRFHQTLSPTTTRWRFFTFHRELSPEELHRFTHVDHEGRDAVVATVDGEIIGVGRYDHDRERNEAEIAFVVTDEWQGRGVGRALLDELVSIARRRGIARFTAVTLADNHRMLRTLRASGLPMTSRFDEGTVLVSLDLVS
jgi:RimJ/RimL family protein N-acetyltransferase